MAANGTTETGPLRAAPPITDLIAGLYAALGAVAALGHARKTGEGQNVEVAMLDGMVSMLAYLSSNQLATGTPPPVSGNDHPVAAPYGLFTASDGSVAVAPSTPRILARFMAMLGLGALLDDPRYATNADRVANRADLNARIDAAMSGRTIADWVETLNAAGVPCGPVHSLADALDDPQIRARDMVIEADHPGHGSVRMTGFPMKLTRTPCALTRTAPDMGADAEAILSELGFDAPGIRDLTG